MKNKFTFEEERNKKYEYLGPDIPKMYMQPGANFKSSKEIISDYDNLLDVMRINKLLVDRNRTNRTMFGNDYTNA